MTAATPEQPFSRLHMPTAMPVNRLLRVASWARDRLRPFAGKTVRFACAPAATALTILDNGEVRDAAASEAPDATFTLTPSIALRALAADDAAWREIRISGDNTLASAVAYVAQHLRWDVEEDLSRVFGDVIAHRMVQTGGAIVRAQRQAVEQFTRALASYWTEEQPLFASRAGVENLKRETEALRDAVEQLAQRVASLLQNAR
jgi:ubiquinone biosynthesis protein UbiJ